MRFLKKETIKRWGRMALLVGLSLSAVIIVEAWQEMVKALDLKHLPAPAANVASPNLASPPAVTAPTATAPISTAPTATAPTSTAPTSTAKPEASAQPNPQTSTQASQPEAQTIALSSGSVNDPQQPIAQVPPDQLATRQWYGASFPVENFQAYTSPFGYRSSPDGGYTQEFHYGLDMASPEGSYVRNWWSGKVVEVSDDSNCGTSVVVESGDWTHIYCHMEGHVESNDNGRYMIDRDGGIQVYEGQQVPAGARIGRVGMTGRTTGPHLHWGLKFDSNWVDPALVLRAMYSSQQAASLPEQMPSRSTVQ